MEIRPLQATDRAAWETLARGYLDFYKTVRTPQEIDTAWARLLNDDGIHGLCASVDGSVLGIAHYLFHTAVWAPQVCYLQDLFTAPEARGQGIARALIEAVAAQATARGAARFYWMTQDHNITARGLYDKVAKHNGFIRYDHPMPG
jgi:GNAT superfamily N-acetyltransferase